MKDVIIVMLTILIKKYPALEGGMQIMPNSSMINK